MTSHIDLASTVMKIARSPIDSDGTSISLTAEREKIAKIEHVVSEHSSLAIPEGMCGYYGRQNDRGNEILPSLWEPHT